MRLGRDAELGSTGGKPGRKRCAGFMYRGHVRRINLYKHRMVRAGWDLEDCGE